MITIWNTHLTSTAQRITEPYSSQLMYEAKTRQILDRKCQNETYINIVITELQQIRVILFQVLIKIFVLQWKRLLITLLTECSPINI